MSLMLNELKDRAARAEAQLAELLEEAQRGAEAKAEVETGSADGQTLGVLSLADARDAVARFSRADLDEVRKLRQPPRAVRATLEMVHLLLKKSAAEIFSRYGY